MPFVVFSDSIVWEFKENCKLEYISSNFQVFHVQKWNQVETHRRTRNYWCLATVQFSLCIKVTVLFRIISQKEAFYSIPKIRPGMEMPSDNQTAVELLKRITK